MDFLIFGFIVTVYGLLLWLDFLICWFIIRFYLFKSSFCFKVFNLTIPDHQTRSNDYANEYRYISNILCYIVRYITAPHEKSMTKYREK